MSENEDSYHDTVLDLEAKLKKNVDLMMKLGNSLQGMFMLGPKPLSVYDPRLKHGLGYLNPYTLKQAISQCPKLYRASSLGNPEVPLDVRDTEDILDDASKSQNKMKEKMNDPIAVEKKQNCWSINYKQINALYDDFVPQKELSAEQKYFSSSFISPDKTSNATPSIPASMPNDSYLIQYLERMKKCFETLFEVLQKNCKRETFKNKFQGDIKEMKDVFDSTESDLCEIKKQNEFLKDQLLEVIIKHEVEISVLKGHECVDNSLHAEIEQIQRNSIEIQEGMQARIKLLEKDVQRCQKQSVDFELKLQHEKEKRKWESSLKNDNGNSLGRQSLDYSWISKMEKLENENVSLDFTVQSLIKELDNVKLEYQKLFDSIKKTRSQTQKEMNELIDHVFEKTYAYADIRAENQNLLIIISELKTRLKNVEKEEKHVVSKPVTLQTSPNKQRGANSNNNVMAPGMYRVVTKHELQTKETQNGLSSTGMNVASSVRRPMHRDSNVKKSVLANSKISEKKVEVYVRKNKQTDTISATVISNKENIIDVDVANAPKAKVVLCVSCMNNVLIPCHDKCLAKYKLNVHSNVHRALFTKSRISKSLDTTHVVSKTRLSKNLAQSKSLDTTSVVSKTKIDVGSVSNAKHNVSSAIKSTKGILRDMSLTKYMKDKIRTSRIWQKWFEAKPNVVWSPINTIPNVHNSSSTAKTMGSVKKWVVKMSTCLNVASSCVAVITGYGDYIHGNITIFDVYYVEGLGHNLFSVGKFCDGDLEVAFRSKTCYVRNLEGGDLLTGDRESNLYTISISDMAASSPVCLMSKATSTKSWLWHIRLSHLNFGTINDLTRLDLVDGLLKFKYGKDHLCSTCERGKSKKACHPPKLVTSNHFKLEMLHMDLYGPMRVASINRKKYILVIVDDYPRYTWVYFLHSKDETPKIIKKFITQTQLNYKAKVYKIRTDNGTEFKNATLKAHYEKLGMQDHSWIESMQDELNQFERFQVWELVTRPDGKNIIALKWLWKNKCDAEHIVVRNKSRLVAKGYRQE
ncbi:integrase, catalytic region, zinc finger, CCHC-type containing protein [Tanacetum coccineum]